MKRTRLSRRRIIWLLPHSPPLSPVSKLSLFLSLPVCRRASLPTGGVGVVWGEEPNHTTARKPVHLQIIQKFLPRSINQDGYYYLNKCQTVYCPGFLYNILNVFMYQTEVQYSPMPNSLSDKSKPKVVGHYLL
jgi:hypothetical protein